LRRRNPGRARRCRVGRGRGIPLRIRPVAIPVPEGEERSRGCRPLEMRRIRVVARAGRSGGPASGRNSPHSRGKSPRASGSEGGAARKWRPQPERDRWIRRDLNNQPWKRSGKPARPCRDRELAQLPRKSARASRARRNSWHASHSSLQSRASSIPARCERAVRDARGFET